MSRRDKQKYRYRWEIICLMAVAAIGLLVVVYACLTKAEEKQRREQVFLQDGFSKSTVETSPETIPEYQGEDVITLNGGRPDFTDYDLEHLTGEIYSELDAYGRCGPAVAIVSSDV